MSGGLIFLIPFVVCLSFANHFNTNLIFPSPMDWFWLLILALGCTVLSNHLMLSALKHISAFTLNVTLNLEPVYGIILAFILFKEQKQLGASFYIGILLIALSVLIQMIRIVQQQKKATTS
jgi:drug/metabolite transporter (DMT)-like permease